MTLVDRIKETAKKLDMNLQDVAKAAGIATNSIYGWKNVTPAADKLKAVADVLHVSVDYLLGNTDDPVPAKQDTTPEEQEIVTLFRKHTEDMTEGEKQRYRKSFEELMKVAHDLTKGDQGD